MLPSSSRGPQLLKTVGRPLLSNKPTCSSSINTLLPKRPITPLRYNHVHHVPSQKPSPILRKRSRTFMSTSKCRAEHDQINPTLSLEEYERVSEQDMDVLHENLEIYVEQYGNNDWEVEYSSGVMTLLIPPYGTYVINKQPPNLQIWISSPISGPARFDYIDGVWVHHRKSHIKLGELLNTELNDILEKNNAEEGWEGTGLKY
ncbi:iron donor protein CyaY [Kwoniella shivajii]|uniref:ferroxidase n=1 Tax=Kwoniella shivajii TaxID=564305 RepID=A0ABZ1D959_9TREE|nr:iron donor protein CyaY [Kwoniella shivajii]